MAIGNTVDIVGNITRDPELRFTPGGMAVAQFGVAVNRRRQNRQTNEWIEETSFFDVVTYGTLAENVAESLLRGARVIVTGRLEQRSWETQEGDKRSKVEIVADEVGPSLRWATAEVTKNERREGSGGGAAPAYHDERVNTPAAAQASNGGFARPFPAGPPAYDYDEEPF